MYFYYFLFFFLLLYVRIIDTICLKNGERKKYFFLCFSVLFLLSGLRGESVGGDLTRYLPEYDTITKSSIEDVVSMVPRREIGYLLFAKIISYISPEIQFYLVCTSFFSLIGPFCLFYRYSKSPSTSIIIYYVMGYYTNTFNNIRQSIALSIIFIIIPCLLKRSSLKYYIGVIIAMSFHYSAFVLMLVYPLYSRIMSFKRIVSIAGIGLSIISFFSTLFVDFSALELTKHDAEKIIEDTSGAGYNLFVLYCALFLFISVFYIKNKKRFDERQLHLMSLFVLFQMMAMILQLAAPVFHSMVRMTTYFFIPIMTISVPYIYYLLKYRRDKVIYVSFVSIYVFYSMTRVFSVNPEYNTNSQGVIPYVLGDLILF